MSLDMEEQRYYIETAENPPRHMVVNAESILEISTPVHYHVPIQEEPETDHPEILALLEET